MKEAAIPANHANDSSSNSDLFNQRCVALSHGVEFDGRTVFTHVRPYGGPASVRRSLPELIDLGWNKKINPGKVSVSPEPLNEMVRGCHARAVAGWESSDDTPGREDLLTGEVPGKLVAMRASKIMMKG